MLMSSEGYLDWVCELLVGWMFGIDGEVEMGDEVVLGLVLRMVDKSADRRVGSVGFFGYLSVFLILTLK